MKQQVKDVIALLEEKKQMFEKYEAMTDALSEAVDIDIMEDYITKRADLANKIDELDLVMKKTLESVVNDEVRRALNQSTPRDSLPEELLQLHDHNSQMLDVVRRIRLKNTDITADYQRTCSELSDKIKETSNMPKINKYLNNLATPDEVNNFGLV